MSDMRSYLRGDDAVMRNYDFSRPNRLNRDRSRLLEAAGQDAARRASVGLSRLLDEDVEVTFSELTEVSYREMLEAVPENADICVLRTGESGTGLGVVLTPNTLTSAVIQKLLGGPLEAVELDRPPTEVECALLDLVLTRVLEGIDQALAPFSGLQPHTDRHEIDPGALQIADDHDTVITFEFRISRDDLSDCFLLGLPHNILGPVLEALDRRSASSRRQTGSASARMDDALGHIGIELSVGFIPITMKSAAAAGIQVGDVIRTGHPVDADLFGSVDGQPRFKVRCIDGRQLTAEIVGRTTDREIGLLFR
ncbi:MAG: hypothetical protein GY929_17035 [Actinomycetia bacterium]|nr:hypothetical protein [Actinomycetes bacterium]